MTGRSFAFPCSASGGTSDDHQDCIPRRLPELEVDPSAGAKSASRRAGGRRGAPAPVSAPAEAEQARCMVRPRYSWTTRIRFPAPTALRGLAVCIGMPRALRAPRACRPWWKCCTEPMPSPTSPVDCWARRLWMDPSETAGDPSTTCADTLVLGLRLPPSGPQDPPVRHPCRVHLKRALPPHGGRARSR